MRRIEHPGINHAPAVQTVSSRVRTVKRRLLAGQTLLEGCQRLMAELGTNAGVARLGAGRLFPAAHVLPALSKSSEHAVYYSDRQDARQPLELTEGTVTLGLRNSERWIHCHGRWLDADRQLRCGHLLPDHTTLAQDLAIELTLLLDATLEVQPDEQTNFALFVPHALSPPKSARTASSDATPGVVVRLAPNVDMCEGLAQAAREHGLTRAAVHGGVGSIVGASFADGRVVEPFVTELLIRSGTIDLRDPNHPLVDIEITLIDYTGGVNEGRLAVGENPVLVTCECVLVPT